MLAAPVICSATPSNLIKAGATTANFAILSARELKIRNLVCAVLATTVGLDGLASAPSLLVKVAMPMAQVLAH